MKKKKFVSGFPKFYYDSEINFRNDFIIIAAAFQKGFQPIRTLLRHGKPLNNL
jgi:hypothetical protein